MARLSALPDESRISGLRHVIDFYVYRGLPCARKWPRSPKTPRAETTQHMIDVFRYAVYMYKMLSADQIEYYKNLARGTDLTPRDYFMRAYLGGIDY